MQGKATPAPNAPQLYAGIDVCKDGLDVYLRPGGRRLRLSNDAAGLEALKEALAGHGGAHVTLEATGKYHRPAHAGLHEAGHAVSAINPARGRHFARANGTSAKTDGIDSDMLSQLGERMKPAASAPRAGILVEMQELVRARQAAMADRAAFLNQHKSAAAAFLRAMMLARIGQVEADVASLDAGIARLTAADPE